MYVCLCNGVTERDLREAIEAGASTVEEVAYCTGAGTRCGSCIPTITAALRDMGGEPRSEAPRRISLRILTSAA